MTCAVITPIGPGHEILYRVAIASVQQAWGVSRGPFENLMLLPIDDTRGQLGRSVARNQEVGKAVEAGAEWVFFLDADDVMVPEAFGRVVGQMENFDAIWGTICEQQYGESAQKLRAHQEEPVRNLHELLRMDPYYSLQMGHFVRSRVAQETPFQAQLNTGEDFDYYLRLWLKYRCLKLKTPLFVNRRGRHSTGPRSADGKAWRKSVGQIMQQFVSEHRAGIEKSVSHPGNALPTVNTLIAVAEITKLPTIKVRLAIRSTVTSPSTAPSSNAALYTSPPT